MEWVKGLGGVFEGGGVYILILGGQNIRMIDELLPASEVNK